MCGRARARSHQTCSLHLFLILSPLLESMGSLLLAQFCSVVDHIWALLEDPGYFAEQVLQMEELAATRYDNIRDEGGRSMGEAPPNDDIF